MKNKKDIVKSYITFGSFAVLWIITLIAFIKVTMNENIFMMIFTLFSNAVTMVITYYFTRKTNEEKSDK